MITLSLHSPSRRSTYRILNIKQKSQFSSFVCIFHSFILLFVLFTFLLFFFIVSAFAQKNATKFIVSSLQCNYYKALSIWIYSVCLQRERERIKKKIHWRFQENLQSFEKNKTIPYKINQERYSSVLSKAAKVK